jgi:hypothetical protein
MVALEFPRNLIRTLLRYRGLKLKYMILLTVKTDFNTIGFYLLDFVAFHIVDLVCFWVKLFVRVDLGMFHMERRTMQYLALTFEWSINLYAVRLLKFSVYSSCSFGYFLFSGRGRFSFLRWKGPLTIDKFWFNLHFSWSFSFLFFFAFFNLLFDEFEMLSTH